MASSSQECPFAITGYDVIVCPYCDHETTDYDLHGLDEGEEFEFTCEKCDKRFFVTYECNIEYKFDSYKKTV